MSATAKGANHAPVPEVDLLLVTVTRVEVEAVFAALGTTAAASRHIFNDKIYYDGGEIDGSRIFMVRSEMGSGGVDGSFPTIDDAIRTLNPGAAIMVGIAFGVDPDKQRIGDILVARQLQGYDLKRVGTDIDGQPEIILRGDRPSCSPRLLDRFRHAELDWRKAGVKFGLMLAGASLVDHIDYRNQLTRLAPEALGGEMEGCGLYAAAHRHKVDWLLVKAICDFADGNKGRNKEENQQLAAANAAGFVTHVLKLGGLAKERSKSSTQGDFQAEEDYLKNLRDQCNYLPLGAMGGEQDFRDGISLDQVYVELRTKTMVPLADHEKRKNKTGRGDDDFAYPEKKERPLSAREAAARTCQLVLLGDPGSGKSTFVRQLAADLAAARLLKKDAPAGWEDKPLPLLLDFQRLVTPLKDIPLEDLSERQQCECLAKVVHAQWQSLLRELHGEGLVGALDQFLEDGRTLIILDGLDEVPEGIRGRIRQAVQAVRRFYSKKNRMIVTCRIRSYQDETGKLAGFEEHILAPFSEEQIENFTMAWYKAQPNLGTLCGIEPEQRAENLKIAALSKDLRELSENPLLLTTMAIIHQKETELPRQRVCLYDKAVEVLLSRWQKEKPGIVVPEPVSGLLKDYRTLRTLMEQLAYLVHRQQSEAGDEKRLSRGELLTFLEQPEFMGKTETASGFLDFIDHRAGLLIGHGGQGDKYPKTYSFPHRTFQEYLAGCRMVRGRGRDIKREYRQRAGERNFWTLAARLGAEEIYFLKRDNERLLDLIYSLCPGAAPLDEGAWRAHLWSGQMAIIPGPEAVRRDIEEPDGGAAYLERLIPRLCSLVQGDSLRPIERAEAGRVLAKLGDPRPGVGLTEDGLPDIEWKKIEAGPFIMGKGDKSYTHDLDYGYDISRYPVTNTQFQAFVKAKGYLTERYWDAAIKGGHWYKGAAEYGYLGMDDVGEPFNLDNHPVVGVTWYEAMAFCSWLTERLHTTGKLENGRVITLPNEPEWEKAARGKDGRIYPWGNDLDPDRANYDKTGIGTTSAVGCFPGGVSPYEVEEMSGNVWEWTRSLFGEGRKKPDFGYPYNPDDGREAVEASPSVKRVLRGGSCGSSRNVRCAFRGGGLSIVQDEFVGFRVVSHHHFKH